MTHHIQVSINLGLALTVLILMMIIARHASHVDSEKQKKNGHGSVPHVTHTICGATDVAGNVMGWEAALMSSKQ